MCCTCEVTVPKPAKQRLAKIHGKLALGKVVFNVSLDTKTSLFQAIYCTSSLTIKLNKCSATAELAHDADDIDINLDYLTIKLNPG